MTNKILLELNCSEYIKRELPNNCISAKFNSFNRQCKYKPKNGNVLTDDTPYFKYDAVFSNRGNYMVWQYGRFKNEKNMTSKEVLEYNLIPKNFFACESDAAFFCDMRNQLIDITNSTELLGYE